MSLSLANSLFRALLPGLALLMFGGDSLHALDLIYPTANHNLLEHPEEFYMKTARSGAEAWRGGMYGFSRNAKHLKGGTVYTRFHEGVDIAPVARDGRGVPLDSVVAIDTGTVVYVNAVSGRSNYGKYIVVRHVWGGSPFYSLYAHLNETWVDSGMQISQGTPIGLLGYTGAGINRARAHLHFEIAMLVNWNFPLWYQSEYRDGRNYHGYYNGINMAGLNVARLYERLAEEPDLSIRTFIEEEHEPFYTVRVPRTGRLDLLWRYPWLLRESAPADHRSWDITFDPSGLPLAIKSAEPEVEEFSVIWAAESPVAYSYRTKSRLRGSTGSPSLSGSGKRFMRLLTESPDSATYAMLVSEGIIGDDGGRDREKELLLAARKAYLKELKEERAAKELDTQSDPVAVVEETQSDPDEEVVIEVVEVSPEELEATKRSILHTAGHSFIWIINGRRWKIELQPVTVRVDAEDDDIDGAGVDTIRALCPSCADYGIAQPLLRRIDDVTWGIILEVTDRKKMAGHARTLNGTLLDIPLLIVAEGERSTSLVQVRLVLRK